MQKKHFFEEVQEYLALKYNLRRNELTLELEVKKENENQYSVLDNLKFNSIWLHLNLNGFKIKEHQLEKIIKSDMIKGYNPLKDYFKQLPKWDGVDYIGQLANTVELDEPNTKQSDAPKLITLWKKHLTKWLVASVACALGKGLNHTCLVLSGGQGIGKTTWLNKLCPPQTSELLICSHINPSLTDQNTANFLAEKWIVNIDDQLETIFGKDFNSMKAIITAPFITNRKTWHRFYKKRDRVCSFVASVNSPEFLTDSENRRYLVFSVLSINHKHNIDINGIWSQALHLLKNYPYWFNAEEMRVLNLINESYRRPSVEEEWLSLKYSPAAKGEDGVIYMMSSEILSKLCYYSGMKLNQHKLSYAIKKLGFGKPITKRINDGLPRKVYPVIPLDKD